MDDKTLQCQSRDMAEQYSLSAVSASPLNIDQQHLFCFCCCCSFVCSSIQSVELRLSSIVFFFFYICKGIWAHSAQKLMEIEEE